jgi:hypothetical protein
MDVGDWEQKATEAMEEEAALAEKPPQAKGLPSFGRETFPEDDIYHLGEDFSLPGKRE